MAIDSSHGRTCSVTLVRETDRFVVKTITNYAGWRPGDSVTWDEVKQICALPNWTVMMIDNDILEKVLSSIGNIVAPRII